MKVLALNGSPSMDKGNTALILSPFLEGIREAGAEVELYHTRKLTINPCGGEYNCWLKTPGECFQQDDMQMLYPKLRAADVWVLASPLFADGLAAPLKILVDRFVPLFEPTIEIHEGHCRHPRRASLHTSQLVLVSNCGFWEKDNFNMLVGHMRTECVRSGIDFAGALLRPHGPALRPMRAMGQPVDDVLDAARAAGRQLVTEGHMSAEVLSVVSRELLPLESYLRMVNGEFRRLQDKWTARRGTAS